MHVEPPRRAVVALLALAASLAAAAAFTDAAGRVLVAPAVVVALALAVRDVLVRPVLSADADGLGVRVGWRTVRGAWSEVEQLRVVRDRRSPGLEIALGDGRVHVVLGRLQLGQPVEDVHRRLQALRQSGSASP